MFESFKKASLKVSVLDELLDDEKAKEEVKKEDKPGKIIEENTSGKVK